MRARRRAFLSVAIVAALLPAGTLADWPTYRLENHRSANDTGGVHSFGGAAALPSGGYWPNWDIAVQLVLR